MIRIAEIVAPVFGVILIGFLYARFRPADMSTANRLNMSLFSPALVFYVLSERVSRDVDLPMLLTGGAVVFVGSGVLAWPLCRLAGWDPRTVVPPAMFKNTGNMGLPLAVFAFGEAALPLAVGLFVVSMMLQFTLGVWLLARRLDALAVARNPVVLAALTGFAAYALDWHVPALLLPGVEMMADVAIPLMLVSLGVRLTDLDLSYWRIGLLGGLVSPLTGIAVVLPWVALAEPEPLTAGVLILFAVLPPAVFNYILAESFRQEPARVAAIVAFGNLAALAVVPVALAFLI